MGRAIGHNIGGETVNQFRLANTTNYFLCAGANATLNESIIHNYMDWNCHVCRHVKAYDFGIEKTAVPEEKFGVACYVCPDAQNKGE